MNIRDPVSFSGKYSRGPNFVLFVLSLSEQKFNMRNVRHDGRVFLCKIDRTKIKHTTRLEIAQNEIWTPQKKFLLYGIPLGIYSGPLSMGRGNL